MSQNRSSISPEGRRQSALERSQERKRLASQLPGSYRRATSVRLHELSVQRRPPEKPLAVYSCLQEAIRRENYDPGKCANDQILWTNKGYAKPALTLVGRSLPKALSKYLPVGHPQLEDSYQALGAKTAPTTEHWRHFFREIHEKYAARDGAVERDDKALILDAYAQQRAVEAISLELRVLLDVSGELHSQAEAVAGKFVWNDVPELAEVIQRDGLPIAFAVTPLYALSDRLQLKKLSKLLGTPQVRRGSERPAPNWFQPPLGGAERAFKSGLGDAFGAVLQARFRLPSSAVRAAQARLGALTGIVFVESLRFEYTLLSSSVSVSGESWLGENKAYVVLRSRQELHDLLADALARGLSLGLGTEDTQTLANLLQRLLCCGSQAEMARVLRRWGISWPASNASEDSDSDEPIDYEDSAGVPSDGTDTLLEHLRGSLIAGLHANSSDPGTTGNYPQAIEASPGGSTAIATPAIQPNEPGRNELEFPDIAQVELVVEPVQETTLPSPSPRQGVGTRSRTWWSPPTQQDQERDRRTGERGEQLVYRDEVKRVTALGYPSNSVVWTSKEDPAADHDIKSVADDGRPLWIEVKSALGSDGQCTWPRSEFLQALQEGDHYELWRVYNASSTRPVAKRFRDPVQMLSEGRLRLDVASLSGEVEPAEGV